MGILVLLGLILSGNNCFLIGSSEDDSSKEKQDFALLLLASLTPSIEVAFNGNTYYATGSLEVPPNLFGWSNTCYNSVTVEFFIDSTYGFAANGFKRETVQAFPTCDRDNYVSVYDNLFSTFLRFHLKLLLFQLLVLILI